MIDMMSTAETYWCENDVQVFPCRCGTTHRGAYSAEDYNHHECFHDVVWDADGLLICTRCGESIAVEEKP